MTAPRGRLMRALGGGLLWGQFVMPADAAFLPLGPPWLPAVSMTIYLCWCVSGLVFGLSDLLLADRVKPVLAPLVLAGLALPLTLIQVSLIEITARFTHTPAPSLDAAFLHVLWLHLVFGGLALATLAFYRRAARIRSVLTQAVVAGRRNEAHLRGAAARDLRGQVPPERLLAWIGELEQRYAVDRARGDRLLARMTQFLRAAMPSVRTGRATLASELAAIDAYGRLMHELEPALGSWPLRLDDPPPDVDFPPLILLPTVEALSVATGAGVAVRLTCGDSQANLRLMGARAAPPGWLAPEKEQRLRLNLRDMFGPAAALAVTAADAGEAVLEIRLPLTGDAAAPCPPAQIPYPCQEPLPWMTLTSTTPAAR